MAYEPFSTMLSKYGNSVSVCSKLKASWKSVVFTNKARKNSRNFVGVFNKTITPLALPGRDMSRIIVNSYPATRTRQPSPPDFATTFGIIVKYHELWEPLVKLSNMANWTQFLRGYVTLFTIFLKNLELFLQHLNSENNFGIGTVSSRLFILRMTKMAMDWNLEKLGQLCKF